MGRPELSTSPQSRLRVASLPPEDWTATRWGWREWLSCTVLLVAALLVSLAHVPQHEQISPIDEFVYIDYLAKIPEQALVATGEETGEFAREYFACNGVDRWNPPNPVLCAGHNFSDDGQFPFAGKSSADIYTPLYFAATWLVAQPLQFFGADLVDAGRYAGGAWLGMALVVLFLALRRYNISNVVSVSLGLLIAGSLPTFWSHTFISTDATAMLTGAVGLWLATRYMQTGRGLWLFPVFGALAILSKFQNFMAVACVTLFLVMAAFNQIRRLRSGDEAPRRKFLIAAALTAVAPLCAQIVWMVVRSASALSAAPEQMTGEPVSGSALALESIKFFPRMLTGVLSMAELTAREQVIAVVGMILLTSGVMAVAFLGEKCDPRTWFALSFLAVSILGGPALAIVIYVVNGEYFILPARYGLSLLPIAAISVAVFISSSRMKWITCAIILVLFLVSLSI